MGLALQLQRLRQENEQKIRDLWMYVWQAVFVCGMLLGVVMYLILASLLNPSASLCSSSAILSLLPLTAQAKAMSSVPKSKA